MSDISRENFASDALKKAGWSLKPHPYNSLTEEEKQEHERLNK